MMNSVLAQNEIEYLVSVWASEESVLHEVCVESKQRGIEISLIQDVLIEFLKLEEIGIHANLVEYSREQCMEEFSSLESYDSYTEPSLFLTEKGWNRYDTDTWGISVARAKEILFDSQSSAITRIPNGK